MAVLRPIPHAAQRQERWANGLGTTTVILREPDNAEWTVRVSVAKVATDGPFSELSGTRRTLVPLDAPMTLRFPDGAEMHATRFAALHFAGAPAPVGVLPEGATRDFNLMLRGVAQGDALPRTLVGTMLLPAAARWLVYQDSGHATLHAGDGEIAALAPGDAALVTPAAESPRIILDGAGEIILVKLYA